MRKSIIAPVVALVITVLWVKPARAELWTSLPGQGGEQVLQLERSARKHRVAGAVLLALSAAAAGVVVAGAVLHARACPADGTPPAGFNPGCFGRSTTGLTLMAAGGAAFAVEVPLGAWLLTRASKLQARADAVRASLVVTPVLSTASPSPAARAAGASSSDLAGGTIGLKLRF